ncbi:homoserine kinase [Actinocorallia sp. A-T 12471]|uniref:homoserine kinase n=1 Tax=Actinocorallia sp. A-T 12471 TaxID=3089813 RepID=UPI0029D10F4C|nr:homoserine kinase [Actinocorallia sp. A-T 12471]MDX6743749.1 homoserine kinase [Actinocorallia sp. A-T 12471]
MSRSVTVEVPATSANLGPGFDSLGLALSYYDEVTVSLAEDGVEIEIEGEGVELAELGEEHLIVKVFRQAWARIGGADGPAGLRLHCVNRIPHSRGMGSSSAAIVAGITAARALHPQGAEFSEDAALALATEIEGHPDNVAPCLAGGLTIAWTGPDAATKLVRLDVDVPVTVFVPDQRLATERARGLLPESVTHADAAANSARAALLIAALTSKLGYDVLLDATEDRLHQSYRAPAMPGSAALVERLRRAGVPAVISGAGPTVLAFGWPTPGWPETDTGNGWDMHRLNVSPYGARVQPRACRTR